jgi:hypothetical protein
VWPQSSHFELDCGIHVSYRFAPYPQNVSAAVLQLMSQACSARPAHNKNEPHGRLPDLFIMSTGMWPVRFWSNNQMDRASLWNKGEPDFRAYQGALSKLRKALSKVRRPATCRASPFARPRWSVLFPTNRGM